MAGQSPARWLRALLLTGLILACALLAGPIARQAEPVGATSDWSEVLRDTSVQNGLTVTWSHAVSGPLSTDAQWVGFSLSVPITQVRSSSLGNCQIRGSQLVFCGPGGANSGRISVTTDRLVLFPPQGIGYYGLDLFGSDFAGNPDNTNSASPPGTGAPAPYKIEFYAEYSGGLAAGHAVVQFWDPAGHKFSAGLRPRSSDLIGVLKMLGGSTQAGQVNSDDTDVWSWRIVYGPSRKQYEDALAYVQSQAQPSYNFYGHNCTDFIAGVADAAQLTLPDTRSLLAAAALATGNMFVADPGQFNRALALIGDTHAFALGLVQKNNNGSTIGGAPDPPLPTPDACSVGSVGQGLLSDPAGVATTLQVNRTTATLPAVSLATGGQWSLSGSQDANALYAIDWGDGTTPLLEAATAATASFTHVYTTAGHFSRRVVVLENSALYQYDGVTDVGTGQAAQGDTIRVPAPPASTTYAALPPPVFPALPPSIRPDTLPHAHIGQPYSAPLAAAGGTAPYSWSLSMGALPAGLTLNSASGVIAGTPTGTGSSFFIVQVADASSPAQTDAASFALTVDGDSFTAYTLPTAAARPTGLTPAGTGFWFVEFAGNKVAQLSSSGTITEFTVPTANSQPAAGVMGQDGAFWFVENTGNKVATVTSAGQFTEYTVPTPNSSPQRITAGPDGALWFTEYTAGKVGRITTTGQITEYALPAANAAPSAIVTGPDGALWFVEYAGNAIGRITTTGTLTEYALPVANAGPVGIAVGADQAIWFTEYLASRVGRITTDTHSITEYPTPTSNSGPWTTAAKLDGSLLWFTERTGNNLAAVSTSTATAGQITEAPVPTAASDPHSPALDSAGNVWFTEYGSNSIVEYAPQPTVSQIMPQSGPAAGGTQVTITGTNFHGTTGATSVQFGTVSATGVSCSSSTSCLATSPAGSGTVDVRVTTSGGISATTAANQFTYQQSPPVPSVTSLTPYFGPEAGGTQLTISGKNFSTATGGTVIKVNGITATGVSCSSSTSCSAVSPAGTGIVEVTATVAGATSTTSINDQFQYVPPPVVTGIAPSVGPTSGGTRVTITGTNLYTSASATTVQFGANPATGVSCSSTTTCVATSPAGSGIVDVSITNLSGSSATNGADQFTYTAPCQNPNKADITSPTGGSITTGTPTFQWGGGACITQYYLYVGSSYGSTDLYSSGPLAGTVTQVTVSPAIPLDGRTIYVRLWSLVNGGWQAVDHSYLMGACQNPNKADITSPSGGSMTTGTPTFQWAGGSCVTQYYLYVGSAPGQNDLFSAGPLAGTVSSATVSPAIPLDGRTIYVRLWSLVNGGWQAVDHSYLMGACQNGIRADITSPAGGSITTGTPTFQWGGGVCVTQYYLYIGNSFGSADLYAAGPLAATVTSATVSPAIPVDGRTIYVRLWSLVNGGWQAVDHSYLMGACQNGSRADISSPTATTLHGASQTFNWSGGACVTQYHLYIGSSVGAADLLDSGPLASTVSSQAATLPANNTTVYLRLWSLVNGTWLPVDHSYVSAP